MTENLKKQCKKNQLAYIAEAGLEYFVSLLITGAFLASILKNIGVSDAVTGITTSLASFGFMAQFFAVICIKPKKSVKTFVTVLHLINQLMFVFLYMIPSVNVPQGIKTALFIVMFLGGHFMSNIALPFKLSWLMSFVEDSKRGEFTANKEIVSLLGGIVFSYAMGAVVDHFEAIGMVQTGFAFCGVTLFVLCILHFISLLAVRDVQFSGKSVENTSSLGIRQTISKTVANKNLRKIILIDILWYIGSGLTVSFLGVYQVNELGFSLKYVAFLSALHSLMRMAFSQFFGHFADKHSWAKMLCISFVIGSLAFLTNSFTAPSNGKLMYAVYYVLYSLHMAGANSGIMNITFDYVSFEDRTVSLGIKSAIGGLCGFFASFVGAQIVNTLQSSGNILFGHTVYAQQILSFLSGIVYLCAAVYIKKVIFKMKHS